jgi:hypothetical protein
MLDLLTRIDAEIATSDMGALEAQAEAEAAKSNALLYKPDASGFAASPSSASSTASTAASPPTNNIHCPASPSLPSASAAAATIAALEAALLEARAETASTLEVAKSNLVAREQLEDWLFKALAEIEDLRKDLASKEEASKEVAAFRPSKGLVKRSSDLYGDSAPLPAATAATATTTTADENCSQNHFTQPLNQSLSVTINNISTNNLNNYSSSANPNNQSMSDFGRDLLRRARGSPVARSPGAAGNSSRPFNTPRINTRSPQPNLGTPIATAEVSQVAWPDANNSAFNHLGFGPGVTKNVLGMLRRSSTFMQNLSKDAHTDDLFAAGNDDDDDDDVSGGDKRSPLARQREMSPQPGEDEFCQNVDMEAEVATYVDSMQHLMKAKCDELDSLKEFVKYLEKNVLYK